MFAGPLFTREALTAPRQMRHYLLRAGYVAALFLLIYTAGQVAFGWQELRNVGDFARFGHLVFQVLSLVQLSLVSFFALLLAAGIVAQEKDRRTLILLLMTDLRNSELVLGKLLASGLNVAVVIAASVPVFLLVQLFGGVGPEQILWSLALCASTALAAASWGCLVAYWREKTFQTLAVGVLGALLFVGCVEGAVLLAGGDTAAGRAIALFDPYRALLRILDPLAFEPGAAVPSVSALGPVAAMLGLAAALNAATILRVRVWNPNQAVFESAALKEEEAGRSGRAATRSAWKYPVVWREMRTRAYGRKVFAIKLAYLVLAAFVTWSLGAAGAATDGAPPLVLGMISQEGFAFVALALVSLLLINAQAVTSITTERDAATLELLLVTDVSAREFVFGKLAGVLWNTKELVLVPLLLAGWYRWRGAIGTDDLLCLTAGWLLLTGFASMLGIHAGLGADLSRTAIATSLGTMFFLFVGIFVFMMLLVEARSSFVLQFQSFLVFIVVGSIALYASLARRNPSPALGVSSLLLPFLTFYSITSFLLGEPLATLFALAAAYGFTTIAMLVPAVSDFDVALGRTTVDKG